MSLTSLPDQLTSTTDQITSIPDQITSILDQLTSIPDQLTSLPDHISSLSDHLTSLPDRLTSRLDHFFYHTRLPHTGHHFRDAGPTSHLGNNWLNTSTDIAGPPSKRTHTCHPRSERYPTPRDGRPTTTHRGIIVLSRDSPIAENTRMATLSAIHCG